MTSVLRQRKSITVDDASPDDFSKTLRNFDIFEKVEEDAQVANTSSGGFLSLLTFIICSIIIFNEFDYYFFKVQESYSYTVDKSRSDGHIILTFDIIVKTPCSQIGAGVSDEAGADIRSLDDISEQPAFFDMEEDEAWRYKGIKERQAHQLEADMILIRDVGEKLKPPDITAPDVEENVKQTAVETGVARVGDGMLGGRAGMSIEMQGGGGMMDLGNMIMQMMAAQQIMNQAMNNPINELAKPAYNKGEGTPDSCRFFGQTTLAKVKGNLHIVLGKKIKLGGMMGNLHMITFNQKKPDFSHRINQLRFSTIEEFGNEYSLQALDGRVAAGNATGMVHDLYQYYLDVVAVVFTEGKSKYYQYAVTESSQASLYSDHQGIIFKYDFSPVQVEIQSRKDTSFPVFIIRMCSIVGGVLSIAKFCSKLF